jgi:hypothetical protein
MKICWDNLEKHDIVYRRKRFVTMYGVPEYRIVRTYYDYKESCKNCGEPYLNVKKSKYEFCDKGCRKEFCTTHTKPEISLKEKLRREKHYREVTIPRKELARERREEKERRTKLYVKTKELQEQPYALYTQEFVDSASWKWELRKDPNHEDLIQCKCTYCKEWYNPTKDEYRSLRRRNEENFSIYLFCCNIHYKEYYDKVKKIRKEYRKKLTAASNVLLKRELEINRLKTKLKEKKEQDTRRAIKLIKRLVRDKKKNRILKLPIDPVERKKHFKEYNKRRRSFLMKEDPKKFKLKKLMYFTKVRSKQKNLEFDIDLDWLEQQAQTDTCPVTGLKFNYDPNWHRNPFGPSIDRKNNKLGYTKDNCQLVIWGYNAGKGHYSEKDLYTLCKAYVDFNNI